MNTTNYKTENMILTLLHLEQPKVYGVLAILNAFGLKTVNKIKKKTLLRRLFISLFHDIIF